MCIPVLKCSNTPFQCYAILHLEVPGGNLSRVGNMASPLYDVLPGGAYFGNQQDFLALGDNLKNIYLVTPCHLPKHISIPLPLNIAV
jgi:hypothetical protein